MRTTLFVSLAIVSVYATSDATTPFGLLAMSLMARALIREICPGSKKDSRSFQLRIKIHNRTDD